MTTAIAFDVRVADGQVGGDTRAQFVSASVGVTRDDRRDEIVSPLTYSGEGLAIGVAYYLEPNSRSSTYASFDATYSRLFPPSSSGPASEDTFGAYQLRTGMRWRITSALQPNAVALGVEFVASLAVARHLYAAFPGTPQTFSSVVLSLAPTARWERRLGSGQASVSLAVPLLAGVDRSYSDLRASIQLGRMRLNSLGTLRDANGDLAYELPLHRGITLRAAYRVQVNDILDEQPLRSVSQSLSIAFVQRLGAVK